MRNHRFIRSPSLLIGAVLLASCVFQPPTTGFSQTDSMISSAKVRIITESIPDVTGHISLTFLWWQVSNVTVNGPYSGVGFYTFTAKPGMKFVILAYRFQNNGIRPERTPYLNEGEIVTSKGYIYSLWRPPRGIHSEEYSPRRSTPQEISDLIGSSGGYEELLPEERTIGRAVFEIPKDEEPLEIKLFTGSKSISSDILV